MSMTSHRSGRRRTGSKLVLLLLGFFAFLFAMTWERVAIRELNGRIEQLEIELQSLNTDEAMLRVSIQQDCRFTDVQKVAAEKWGMSVADPRQRVLIASMEAKAGEPLEEPSADGHRSVGSALATRVGQLIRPGTSWAGSIGEKDAAPKH